MRNEYVRFLLVGVFLLLCTSGCTAATVSDETTVQPPSTPPQAVAPPRQPAPTPAMPRPGQVTQAPAVPQPAPQVPGVTGQPPTVVPDTKKAPVAPPERKLAPAPSAAPTGMVSLNFSRADLVEVVHIIAQHLKLTYTIDPEVKGTVTINSSEPLRPDDLLPIFHQILRMNGAIAIRTGNLYRIMPIKDGKGLARPVGQSREDGFALQIVPVRFFSVAEMKRLLTPFLITGGEVIEHPRGNFLIIMDLPSNIQRLAEIIDLVDVQVFAGTRMEIYQPKVATAEELSQEMTKIMQSYAASAAQPESFTAQFIALPRINRLLVISHSEAAWTYAKRWLDSIDVVAEGPGRRIFIYPVENGKAAELATVLSQALGQAVVAPSAPGRTLEQLHRSVPGLPTQPGIQPGLPPGFGRQTTPFGTPGTTLQQPQPTPGMYFGSSEPYGAYATVPTPQPTPPVTPGAPAVTPPGVPRPTVPTPGQPPAPRPEEQLRIVPDPATNSLIIYATAQEFQNIRNILKELDIVPRQVLLDVLVAEVTLRDDESLGVDYEILGTESPRIFGETFGSRAAMRSLGALFPTGGQFGTGLTGVFGGGAVKALVNALMTDSRARILSSPSVLASDNRPARIQVGSEEPIPTGTITTAVGVPGVAGSTTIQYRSTGRIVTIIPQVNAHGLVNLQILAEVSQRGADVRVGGTDQLFPSFDTRQAETTAVVQDGDTLAIGGIIADNRSRSRTGIPYLMDIPVLGRFFGTTSESTARTELIMLITPNVIRSRGEGQVVTEELKSKLSTVRTELERIRRERERELPPKAPAPTTKTMPPASELPAPPAAGQPVVPGATVDSPISKGPSPASAPDSARDGGAKTAVNREHSESGSVAQVKRAQERIEVDQKAAKSLSAAEPVPGTGFAGLVKPAPQSQPSMASVPKPVPERATSIRVWVVQVGSHARAKDADSQARELKEKGYDVSIIAAEVGGRTWHRVQVGQLATQRQAVELQKKLQESENLEHTLVAVR